MFVTWLAFSIPLVSAGFLRGFADDAVEMADDLPLLGGEACSFSADTPVATAAGQTAISDVAVGDQVLAWNEETNATGYYTVTATLAHADPVIVHLTIDGETIETTPEHPFYAVASAPWLAAGESQGRWTPAGDLKAGDHIQQADGTTGVVQAVVFEVTEQVMYDLTVARVHTFFVGDGEWLVHNCSLPQQVHHFATNKSSKWTAEFEKITNKYGLNLDDDWNKELLPHLGRHPDNYHQWVLQTAWWIDDIARGDKQRFLELFEEEVKGVIRDTPDMLYKQFWQLLD